jgi:phosphate transport system substrate-binding protein
VRPVSFRITRRFRLLAAAAAAVIAALTLAVPGALIGAESAQASQYVSIDGEGSSWAGVAWAEWVSFAAQDGVRVDYTPNGSSEGRDDFARQVSAMFADSEIPFTGDADDPQDSTLPNFAYSMLPVVAGGTAFAYNLPISGTQFRDLKLNMSTIAGIFSGEITKWNAAPIQATNPGVALPDQTITVVVRSDGSGATAQFKLWMLRQFPSDYRYLAQHTDGNPDSASSYFPTGDLPNFVAQSGSDGVTTYTQQTPYSIDYDEYAYPLDAGMPVAQVENAAGYFTLPTADAVAVALTQAGIYDDKNSPNYLSQNLSKVYGYKDPRSYPMSMYSYEMIPDQTTRVLQDAQGATLAWVSTNAVCSWQDPMGSLGYSPLPMNLVLASMDQIEKVPGIDAATKATISDTERGVTSGTANPCNSPTFKPGQSVTVNQLVETAPFPAGCDAACQAPWIGKDCDNYGTGGNCGAGGTAPGTKSGQTSATPGAGSGAAGAGKKGGGTPAAGSSPTASASGAATTGTGRSCNAATGVCTSSTSAADTTGSTGAASGNVATVLPAADGWASPQTLGAIVVALLLAVLVVPPVVSVLTGRKNRRE